MPDGPAIPTTRVDGQLVVGPIYDKPAASAARGGQFDEEDGAKTGANHMTFVRAVKIFFCFRSLDELADPTADEIPDHGDAHSDHEHVEA